MEKAKHKIQWLNIPGFQGKTWNPLLGCREKSEGCDNCYAVKQAFRLAHMGQERYMDVTMFPEKGWNGKSLKVGTAINAPFKWKSPSVIFVCSMGDLFFDKHKFTDIDEIFAVMASNPQHIFIVLTKRPQRMLKWFNWKDTSWDNEGMRGDERIRYYCWHNHGVKIESKDWKWPLQNVWIGVTAENQKQANKRLPVLTKVPSAVKFVSIEPMLEPVDVSLWQYTGFDEPPYDDVINWVICGGESGHNARPLHPDWVRSVRDNCEKTGTPFFFKQWGEYLFIEETAQPPFYRAPNTGDEFDGNGINFYDPETCEPGKWMGHKFIEDLDTLGGMYWNAGRKLTGNLLDGKTHENYPELTSENNQ